MLAVLLICVLKTMVHLGNGQQDLRAPVGPWRHKIEWENNGRVFSLLSTGTEYLSPVQRRRQTRLLLTSNGGLSRLRHPNVVSRSPRRHRGQMDSLVLGTEAAHQLPATNTISQQPPGIAPTRETGDGPQPSSASEYSGVGVPTERGATGDDSSVPVPTQTPTASPSRISATRGTNFTDLLENQGTIAPTHTEAGRMGSVDGGPRFQQRRTGDIGTLSRAHALRRGRPESGISPTPLSDNAIETHVAGVQSEAVPTTDNVGTHEIDPRGDFRNSVYYGVHPPAGRSRSAARHPTGTGHHGTRIFRNGERSLFCIRWPTTCFVGFV